MSNAVSWPANHSAMISVDGGYRHAIGESDLIGDLTHGAVRCDQRDDSRRYFGGGIELAAAVDVDVATGWSGYLPQSK